MAMEDVLGREMPEHGHLAEADGLGDFPYRHGVVAFRIHEPDGRIKDAVRRGSGTRFRRHAVHPERKTFCPLRPGGEPRGGS